MNEQDQIQAHYNVPWPQFAYICDGLRRIAVDPEDARARRMLLRHGVRYFSRVQFFIYHCLNGLPIDLLLDIGSNYGECAFATPLHCRTKVIGFEANPHLHTFLRRSKLYNDDIQSIEFVHAAVSARAGETLEFFVDTRWSGKSSVVSANVGKEKKSVSVRSTSVDEQIAGLEDRPRVLLMKVDVEGYEPAVFSGAERTIQTVPNIISMIEFDAKYVARGGVDPKDFFASLQSSFDVHELRDTLRPIRNYDDLARGTEEDRHAHTNLVLTRFEDSDVASAFDGKIARQNIAKLAQNLWK